MTAEELLADGEVYEYSNVLVIDAETREINIPLGEEFFGVEGDVKVERKYFSCPKIVGDNIDLSECNIYINYVLADKEGNPKSENVGSYFCDDMVVDGDNIKFTWVLSERVLAEDGYVAFAVVAKKSVNGVLENKWNTTPGVGIVKKTIKDGEELQQQFPDVIDNLINRVHDIEMFIGSGGVGGGSVTSVNGQTGAVNINIPSKTSDLENDKGYITRLVADLENYYLKSETYTQAEINQKLSAIPKFYIKPVESLPTTDISTTTVYLLKSGNETDNIFTEYIYVDGAWEYLGKQTIDLSGYAKKATTLSGYGITDGATKEEVQRLSEEKVDQVTFKQHTENGDIHVTASDKQAWNKVADKVDKTSITLGKHTDGLIYIFVDGQKVGNGVEVTGEVVESDVIGTLDENNNILLSGALADGTYTLKWLNNDGTYSDAGELVVGEVVEEINYFNPSTATLNARIGSSGSTSAYNGMVTSDYIPIDSSMQGKNFVISGVTPVYNETYKYYARICSFAPDKTSLATKTAVSLENWKGTVPAWDSDIATDTGFILISLVIKDNVAITADDIANIKITLE